jgi:phosphoserine phosphatase
MLNAADISVAYHAKPVVREQATHVIDHCGLDAIVNLFL